MRTVAIAGALLALLCVTSSDGFAAARTAKRQLWGAIAYHSGTGAFGYAVDRASKRDAEAEAFRQCGGDCDQVHSFRNNCGALAAKDRRFSWSLGATRAIAEQSALRKCADGTCKIAVWACTSEK